MEARIIKVLLSSLAVVLWGFFSAPIALASNTDGTIDSTYKYAWGENLGWINFGTSGGNVHVTDAGLSGYAWSENYGWINLNPSKSGVKNNGYGILSGYAWGENLGWINFSGVAIDTEGNFTGYATVVNTNSRISFNCSNTDSCSDSNFKVKTDWRPRGVRPACNNGLDDDHDGKIDYPQDPGCSSLVDNDETDIGGGGILFSNPLPPFQILVNKGAVLTHSFQVVLYLRGGKDTVKMAVSNFPDFRDSILEPFQFSRKWNLCKGLAPAACDSKRTHKFRVFAKFYNQWGHSSKVVSDEIIYVPEAIIKTLPGKKAAPAPEKKTIVQKIARIFKPLIEKFIKKPAKPQIPKVSIKEILARQNPPALQGRWDLLPKEPFEKFVLAPLPKQIRILAKKFPQFERTFSKVGVRKITDIQKLWQVRLSLPTFKQILGTSKTLPLVKLSSKLKQKLPEEVVFAKTGGEKIDFNIALNFKPSGEVIQKIRTVSGRPLELVVKPEGPVNRIKGYLVFKSKRFSKGPILKTEELSLNQLLASAFFIHPALAKPAEKARYIALEGERFSSPERLLAEDSSDREVETRLLLREFDYTDPDGDGIYTAHIQAPQVSGEYEIITVIDYKDIRIGKKEIRLVAAVDPEGYVFEKISGKEFRIPGAIVSLYWLNPASKKYELWNARDYQQENPQITDNTGRYAFLVPGGFYYIKAEAPGYLTYLGKPFQVKEGSGIHFNIELRSKYWWLKIIDWKMILIALVMILLLYNFYRDTRRERMLRGFKH